MYKKKGGQLMNPNQPAFNAVHLSILDWIVLVLYAAGMLLIGWIYSRKNKTKKDYLLGGGNMNPNSVGISLFATLMSALSYLTYPAEMIQHGPAIFAGVLSFPLVYYVVGWWLIPKIREYNVTSAYEILEKKLGVRVRMLSTFMFLSLRLLWMATIIYATVDIAFVSVIHIDRGYVPVIEMIITAIIIVYTAMGGLKAVVMTDVIQSGIFLGAALLTILIAGYHLPSFSDIIPAHRPEYWDSFQLGFDPSTRTTIGNSILVLFVWYICTNGSDQMAIQRYLSSKDIKTARKTLKVALYSNTIAYILLAFVGLSVLSYFVHQGFIIPDQPVTNEDANMLFPKFIVLELPVGISGLVIAGILAASMSSMSSGLNSMSSVIFEDIIKRFRKKKISPDKSLTIIKQLSIAIGIVVMGLSIYVSKVPGNLLDVVMRVVNLFVAPLFVPFFMTFFIPFATEKGTFWGSIIAIIFAIAVAFFQLLGITVLWIMPLSLLVGILSAVIFSLIDNLFSKKYKV